jgi:hypothetical protein
LIYVLVLSQRNTRPTYEMILRYSFVFLICLTAITTIPILKQTHALQQVAGPIVIEIKPGETKPFAWGLLTDMNETNAVNVSADGIGSEFLSYPKKVDLVPKEIKSVPGNISIPFDYPGGIKLNATLVAKEAGKEGNNSGGIGVVTVKMLKTVDITVGKNPFSEFRELISRPYIENAQLGNTDISVPIQSTSNITGFMFDESKRAITFNATGYSGTNGTTAIYLSKLLEAPYFISIDGKPFTAFDPVTNKNTGEKGIKVTYPHDSIHDNFSIAGARVVVPSSQK